MDAGNGSVGWAMIFAAAWNYLLASVTTLVWRANHGAIIPVLLTSFLVTMVAAMAGVLMGTVIVATRRARRVKVVPHASFRHHHPV